MVRTFLIDASFSLQLPNMYPKFSQFVNPAKLGVNSLNPVQPLNIF